MEVIDILFGHGKDLNALQMSMRGIILFFITIILIRIAGRRSFGLRMPLDNVITILLGAILSRAVTGASAFWPTVAASTIISVMHRIFASICVHSEKISNMLKGRPILLYKDGIYFHANLKRGQVTEDDILERMRLTANIDELSKIECVYLESDGEISIVKKESS